MRLYLRSLSYFRSDSPLILLWLLLIGLSLAAGMLSVWPMAILVDSVLTQQTRTDWAHRLFLSPLPDGRLGQIVGLAVAGLLLKLFQEIVALAQSVVSNHINYNGLTRVRCDLFRKLQALGVSYHKEAPQGDAIYRLSSDAFGCQAVLNTAVSAAVAAITLAVIASLLLTRNVRLTLLALSIAPPLAVLNVVFGRRLRRAHWIAASRTPASPASCSARSPASPWFRPSEGRTTNSGDSAIAPTGPSAPGGDSTASRWPTTSWSARCSASAGQPFSAMADISSIATASSPRSPTDSPSATSSSSPATWGCSGNRSAP